MTKRSCVLIGMHALFVTSITAGYICMLKEIKKTKQKYLDL